MAIHYVLLLFGGTNVEYDNLVVGTYAQGRAPQGYSAGDVYVRVLPFAVAACLLKEQCRDNVSGPYLSAVCVPAELNIYSCAILLGYFTRLVVYE